jgi:hypothetical protein
VCTLGDDEDEDDDYIIAEEYLDDIDKDDFLDIISGPALRRPVSIRSKRLLCDSIVKSSSKPTRRKRRR